MPNNETLSPPINGSGTGVGSGVVIGDGVMLTAGHVMFEFNLNPDPTKRLPLRMLNGTTVFYDPRGYEAAYIANVTALPLVLPSVPPPYDTLTTFDGYYIENNTFYAPISLTTKDMIFVTSTAKVDKDDAGLALYLEPADMVSTNFGLVSGTRYQWWGAATASTMTVQQTKIELDSQIGVKATSNNHDFRLSLGV